MKDHRRKFPLLGTREVIETHHDNLLRAVEDRTLRMGARPFELTEISRVIRII